VAEDVIATKPTRFIFEKSRAFVRDFLVYYSCNI
jgi:hypothetical protein